MSIITDVAIPSAVFLSIVFLGVKYRSSHFWAIALVCLGVSIGFLNDYLNEKSGAGRMPLAGDLLALVGGFLYALENVLMEHFVRKPADVFNFLGFIGLFGAIVTFAEAVLMGELEQLANVQEGWKVAANYAGMAAVEFVVYTIIPFYVTRSGATLLNLSDTTTIVWSMLCDRLLYGLPFHWLPPVAFVLEVAGIVIFSLQKPEKAEQ